MEMAGPCSRHDFSYHPGKIRDSIDLIEIISSSIDLLPRVLSY